MITTKKYIMKERWMPMPNIVRDNHKIIDDVLLIKVIKQRQPLWHMAHDVPSALWNEVPELLGFVNNSFSYQLKIRARWEYLRSKYLSSKKIRASSSVSSTRKPFKFESLMRFLDHSSKPKITTSIDEFKNDDDFSSDSAHSGNIPKQLKRSNDKFDEEQPLTPGEKGFMSLLFETMWLLTPKKQRELRVQFLQLANNAFKD